MPGSWPRPELASELPNLSDSNSRVTSRDTPRYNCIAWAAGEDFRNWWPDLMGIGYWPPSIPREEKMPAFVRAYETLNFRLCIGGVLENGIEKLALYGKRRGEDVIPTHAALQLESGEWTSKLGRFEDISHASVEDVYGPCYGEVIFYMARPRNAVSPYP